MKKKIIETEQDNKRLTKLNEDLKSSHMPNESIVKLNEEGMSIENDFMIVGSNFSNFMYFCSLPMFAN